MKKLGAFFLALPLMAASLPAMATTLTGSYLVTLGPHARPTVLANSTSCFTLTQTSNVKGWQNSGTWTSTPVSGFSGSGNYYAIGGVLTLYGTVGPLSVIIEGKLNHANNISNTSFLALLSGTPYLTSGFSATIGCP